MFEDADVHGAQQGPVKHLKWNVMKGSVGAEAFCTKKKNMELYPKKRYIGHSKEKAVGLIIGMSYVLQTRARTHLLWLR